MLIHMMVGIPASGKSTYASKLSKELNIPIVSSDSTRAKHPGVVEKDIWPLIYEECFENVKNKQDFIYDATNITPKVRKRFFDKILERYSEFEVCAYYFNADPKVCFERCVERNKDPNEHHLPPSVVLEYGETIIPPTVEEGFKFVKVIDMIYTKEYKNFKLEVSRHGGRVVGFYKDGKNYIRKADEMWGSTSPILFPIVGLFKDNYAMINGERYEMGSHGFIRHHDLDIVEEDEVSFTLIDKWSEDSLKLWPFKHELRIKYEIVSNGFKVTLNVANVDNKDIYFNIGGHPGVICPMNAGEEFTDYRLVFNKPETFDSPSINGNCLDWDHPEFKFQDTKEINLDYKYFMVDAIVDKDIVSSEVRLLNKENKGYSFTWDNFNTVAFWTKPNGKYLCFEPWKGYADKYDSTHNFMEKDDLVDLKAGENTTFSYTVKLID